MSQQRVQSQKTQIKKKLKMSNDKKSQAQTICN